MNEHPSQLELYRSTLGAAAEATRAHVAGCAQCQAALGKLEPPVAIPAWVRALPREKKPAWKRALEKISPRGIGERSLRAWLGAGAIACAAAVLLIALRPKGPEDIGAKGAPSVAVYVKRAGQVSLWDGLAPLRAGDAVQLQVQPEAFTQLSVASLEHDGAHAISSSALPAHAATLLSQSLVLDASPTTLLLVFSRAPIEPARLDRIAKELPRTKEVWATRLALSQGAAP